MEKETFPLNPKELTLKDAFELYENGKDRRYKLLFAVNGGAFAIVKLWAEKPDTVLGALNLQELSVGMAAFTIIMVVDIHFFGEKMRTTYSLASAFGPIGKAVLYLIGLLLCAGWLLAGFGK